MSHFVSKCCIGELCRICRKQASHKVEETIFDDEPEIQKMRHELTSYVCCEHFVMIMGPICTQACVEPKEPKG